MLAEIERGRQQGDEARALDTKPKHLDLHSNSSRYQLYNFGKSGHLSEPRCLHL